MPTRLSRLTKIPIVDRAIRSAAQGALLALGADKVLDAVAADWSTVASFSAGAAILSLLTSIAFPPEG